MNNRYKAAEYDLEQSLMIPTELEGGISHPIEELEELRLSLAALMNKDLLDSLLFLFKELNREPRESEMYAWFVRNSQVGGECKFAQQALTRFKRNRLDTLEPLLERSLAAVKTMKEERDGK